MKSRITTIEFPVFGDYIVHVEISSDIKKSMAKYPVSKVAIPETDDNMDACVVHTINEGVSMVFLPYNVSVGTLAHEAWHVVKHMMEFMGVELDSETVAYHLGYLVNRIFKFIRKNK